MCMLFMSAFRVVIWAVQAQPNSLFLLRANNSFKAVVLFVFLKKAIAVANRDPSKCERSEALLVLYR